VAGIFISYARDDDVPPPGVPKGKGFVTFLDEAIRYEFRNLGPERPSIWRDTRRISDSAQFTPEIEEALKDASFLLVVLSPNWMARPWCRRELDTFAKYHGPDGIRERIFVVSKRHVEHDKRPSLLQGQVGFEFYVRDTDPGEIGGDQDFFGRGQVLDDRYWAKVSQLAASLLLRKPPPVPKPLYPPSGRTIFVAKPASDMRAGYDRIVSELAGKGHSVVPPPAEDIPLDSSATEVIDAALERAEISVHLLGEKTGGTPEDHQSPIVNLQLARAAAKAAASGENFHRVVWAPSFWTIQSATDRTPHEVSRLPHHVLEQFGASLQTDKVQGDGLSKFVDFLNQHLVTIFVPNPVERPTGAALDAASDVRLYLEHSEQDSEYALSLAEALQQHRLETLLPAFEGSESEIRMFNDKQLAECDAVVLCWASASEVWVRAHANLYRDWHALGRKQQFSYRAVLAAPPPGTRKKKGKVLFPRSEIDLVVDLSDKEKPTADLLDALLPAARATPA
jgi:TIR domain